MSTKTPKFYKKVLVKKCFLLGLAISLSLVYSAGILIEAAFAQCDADASRVCSVGTWTASPHIRRVVFNEINKINQGGYRDYTATDSTTLTRGQTYTITVYREYTDPCNVFPAELGVYIDWDNDGDLIEETRIDMQCFIYCNPSSAQITVPQNAAAGPLVMRVIMGGWRSSAPWCQLSQGACNPCGQGCVNGPTNVIDFSICVSFIDIGLRVHNGSEIVAIAAEPTEALTSPLRIAKNGTIYGIVLVDPGDPNDSGVRIQTSGGIKALRKLFSYSP